MENEKKKLRERTKIHLLEIVKSGDKLLFQITLPKNAVKITGILVTVQPINKNLFPSDTPLPPFPFPTPIPVKEPVVLNAAPTVTTLSTVNPASTNRPANLFPIEQIIF